MGISIKKIGITKIEADIIVNAANEQLMAGGGVCGAIFKEAGYEELTKVCETIGTCKTGTAVMTPAFKLPAKYIIHAVGPRWMGGKDRESEKLFSVYKNSLELAMVNNCHSIAFPLISAGIFGYPKESAWEIAILACKDFLNDNKEYGMDITFAVLDDEMLALGTSFL